MTWTQTKSTGNGTLRYALVIEGFPYIFVTDKALTIATDKSGRTVVEGLLYEGLAIRERALPGEGKIQADGMTFKFRSPYGTRESSGTTDIMCQIFAKRGAPVGALGTALATTTATTIGLVGASTLSNDTYYYIGTETILTATSPTISRGLWGSTAQKHNTTYVEGIQEVYIYDYPTTIDGRRVTLYVYADGDSVATLTNAIWRGVVARAPRLDGDGITWSVTCQHISQALKQSVVGEQVELRPMGFYHHTLSPIYFKIDLGSTGNSGNHWVAGYHRDEAALIEAVNTELAAALSDAGATTTEVKYMRLTKKDERWCILARTGSAASDVLGIRFYSPLLGGSETTWHVTGNETLNMLGGAAPANSTTYLVWIHADAPTCEDTPTISAAAPPVMGLGGPVYDYLSRNHAMPNILSDAYGFSPWRIYINHDWSTVTGAGNEGDFGVYIAEDAAIWGDDWAGVPGGTFNVVAYGTDGTADAFYIEVEPVDLGAVVGWLNFAATGTNGFHGFLSGDTVIRPVVNFGAGDAQDFADWMTALTARAPDANDGITPFLTTDDWDTSATLEGNVPDFVRNRRYAFLEPVSIEEVLAQELLLSGHMLYTTTSGKLSFRRIPLFTDTTPTTYTVTGTKIITPADGFGAWPGYELTPQGVVATVKIHQGFVPATGEWEGATYEIRDADLVSRYKKRGVGTVEIKPYSNPDGAVGFNIHEAVKVGTRLISFMGREYASVRVHVPFTAFDYVLGTVVSLTSPHVPYASDGSRGLTGKRAVVMGRDINLDPANKQHVILDLWILIDQNISGYAPSAYITAHTNTSGNTWSITCDVAESLNIVLSSTGNGQCLEHFADGDYIKVCQVNGTTEVTGRISGTPSASAGTCTVVLDAAWTPGSDDWTLEYQDDSGSTAQTGQRAYAYVADNNKKLANGAQGRVFT